MSLHGRALVLALIGTIGYASPAAAQQAIRGVVLDDETNRPVASATVRLIHADVAESVTTTDAAGIQRQDRDLCGLVVIWTKAGW